MNTVTLSEEFKRRITGVWGEEGRAWLERLPALVATCRKRWSLSINTPLTNLSYNFVAPATRDDGTETILKIGVPNAELITEIEALQLYGGNNSVTLLESDCGLGALLLQRLAPGNPLADLADDEKATMIAAQIMQNLPALVPADHPFPTVEQCGVAFKRLRERFKGKTGPLPRRMVEKAEYLLSDLENSSPQQVLLHGDLHHRNILFDQEYGWLAIDPKGVIGDPAYEAARFQHNPIPGFLAMDYPQRVALRRIEILASVLKIDPSRLLAWGFFDAMLTACWSIEDNEDWHYLIACAKILEAIM
jgi:streptomycin 6-kinase